MRWSHRIDIYCERCEASTRTVKVLRSMGTDVGKITVPPGWVVGRVEPSVIVPAVNGAAQIDPFAHAQEIANRSGKALACFICPACVTATQRPALVESAS